MIVVVAGMKRSGSTWMFNVARIALERAGIGFEVGEYDLYKAKPDANLLIKTHWWHGNLADDADVILSSERDVEDVYASLHRFWGRRPTGREVAKIVEHHRRWHKAADHRMSYGDLLADPAAAAAGIVAALGVDADPACVLADVQAIEPPASGQDAVTLLFHNHRTST